MTDKLRSISMLIFASASLIGAIAALAFALRGGEAHADGGSAHYQLTASYDPGNKTIVLEVIDTTTGRIWEKINANGDWDTLGFQFDPKKR
jgi:hypothetical protein